MNTLNKISRITVLVSLALLALSNTDVHAQTSVSGNQTGVWRKAGSPYLVVGSVTVPSGDSLRIEPGVVVNVEQANFAITVRGTLNAIGTAADSILITSNKPTKAGGQWDGIEFLGGRGTLDYCVIEAAGSNNSTADRSGIRIEGSSSAVSISHSVIRKIINTSNRVSYGLWIRNSSSATVMETRIEEVETDGIRVELNAAAIVTACEIRNNGNDGLEFSTSGSSVEVSSVTATNIHNNAGYGVRVNSSGKSPEIRGNVISGNGIAGLGISGTIDQNMAWEMNTDLIGATTLSAGRTLTIAPGVVVEGIGSTIGLTIQGNLMAVGSVADSIVFTSDDAIKAGGQWRGITISGQGTFDYCVIEAAGDQATGTGSAITTSGAASLTLRRSTIYKISNTASGRVAHGFWLSSANSVGALADVRINEVQADGFRQESSTSANLTAVSIFSCGGNGIFTDGTLSRVRNSRVIGNNRGIHIARGAPNLGTLTDPGFNAIYNNADYQLYNATTNTILAQNNFWSATDSATIDARVFDDEENTQTGTTGILIFSPWLNQEPSPEPLPPVAEAGPNQTVGENVVVTLDGRTSRDPENAPLTFAWTQTAGPAVTLNNPNNAVTTFTTPTVFLNQTLTFRLQVSDGMLADMDLVTVTVLNNINESPVAHAGPDQTVAAGVLVTLDGTGSSDPNNQTLTFQWTQISGVAVTLNNPAMAQPTFIAPSIVTGVVLGFQLQVSDGALAARDTVTITVLDRPTLVTFNLDMRPLQRLGLFRPEKGMRPLVNFFGSNVQQNALLSDSNADSVWSAPVLQPGGATARYAFALDPNGDGLNPSGEWVFELDSLANNVRSLVVPTGRDTVLSAVLFDNVPSQAIAPNYAALVTRNFRPGDSPATVFDEPSEQSFVTLDFSTLNKGAVVAIRRYGTGPGGDLPSGIAVLAKNVYWGIEASPTAANFSARLIINYDPLNGIVDPNALRLLRRNSPQAQWQVVATELNALAKTLTATNVSSIGEWTLGSNSTVNPLEPQPPGLVSKPNPPDGEAQVFEKPRLSWLAAAAGRSYDLFLWPDTGKSPATPTAANLTGPSFQIVNALPFGAKFKWQVIAKNIDGATASLVWSFTVQTLTDLQVTAVNVPNEAFSGQSIEVSWVVTNNSTAPTDAARWFDQVYLSANPVFNSATATSLGQFENVAFLPAGEGYTNTKQFTLPQGIIGNYYIFVATDVTKRQRESNDNNNITRSPQPIKINLTPPPDLQVTRILSPDNAFSGNRIDFSYTVTNKGPGTTGMFEWFDAIFFSKDLVLNANAQQLGSGVRHVGVLDPDSSYTIRTNVIIPKGAQGPSYLFVATDVTNQVFEFALEPNNVGRDSIHITLTPPPDLVVKSVTIAASAASGDSLTVDWTV
ncbi:MAG: PKD domain-containing protein, partial [bacterium]